MVSDPLGPILIFVLLIIVQGWMASVEEAFRSLSEARLQRESEEGDRRAAQVLALNERQARLMTALHFCARFAAFAAVCVMIVKLVLPMAAEGSKALYLLGASLVLALITLLFGDELPRRIAERHPEETAKRAVPILRPMAAVLHPLVWLIAGCARLLMRLSGIRPDDGADEVTEEDIRLMVDIGEENGAIEAGEKEMIENIFEFNNRSAEDVMIHRTDVVAIPVDAASDEVMKTILETGLSRFPVYGEDIDDILGVLNTRVFLLNNRRAAPRPLRELLREPYFVPEHVQADALFRDMQKRKLHMAIVVDEYGGMSGIVTMEDLLEEIVGNIYDEFDQQIEAEIVRLGENLWRISGAAPLEDVAEALSVELPTEEDYDTLGGLIFSELTTIPEDGSQPEVDAAGLHIRVEKLLEHRVESAIVSILRPDGAPTEEEQPHE